MVRLQRQGELFSKISPREPGRSDHNSTVFTSSMQQVVHRWFRYSAGFSAAWAQDVIGEAAAGGSEVRVFDPFVGSGTTLLAAQAAGVVALGVENQPFVARLARAKLQWSSNIDEFIERSAEEVLAKAVPLARDEEPKLLAKVYDENVLAVLRGMQALTPLQETDEPTDALLWLALVAILRRCSPAGTAPWQYILPNKRKARVLGPEEAYRAQVSMMVEDMAKLQEALPRPTPAVVLEEDARNCVSVPEGWATLVVTSPPYANNYDYADATRLEMTFLGDVTSWADLAPVRDRLVHSCSQHMAGYDVEKRLKGASLNPLRPEIESVVSELAEVRQQHGGKKAYHSMVVAYFSDLAETWVALRRACAPGARVCFVIGDSAPYDSAWV